MSYLLIPFFNWILKPFWIYILKPILQAIRAAVHGVGLAICGLIYVYMFIPVYLWKFDRKKAHWFAWEIFNDFRKIKSEEDFYLGALAFVLLTAIYTGAISLIIHFL